MAAGLSSPTPELVSPHRWARGKYLALASLIGLGMAGVWHSAQSDLDFHIDRGEPNQAHRVLIYAYGDQGLHQWLQHQILTHGAYAFRKSPAPVNFEAQQRRPDADLQSAPDDEAPKLDHLLALADEQGFGYVALALQGPQSEKIKALLTHAAPALQVPSNSRWAVIRSDRRVNNLEISLGEVQSGIEFSQQAAARASLMQALFADPELGELHRAKSSSSPPMRRDLASLPLSRRGLDFRSLAWQPFSFAQLSQHTIEEWPDYIQQGKSPSAGPMWLASPMQQVDAVVLNPRSLILKTSKLAWSSQEGTRAALKSKSAKFGWELSVVLREAQGIRTVHCEGISGTRALAVRAGLAGDAIEVRRPDNTHEVYSIHFDEQDQCHATRQSLTKAGSEPLVLGLPEASGITSWIAAGTDKKTLAWRKNSKMGRVTLQERTFARDRWQWVDERTLKVVTLDPNDPEQEQLQVLHLDPELEGGMRVEDWIPDSESPQPMLPSPAHWPELSYETRASFGARIPQATFFVGAMRR